MSVGTDNRANLDDEELGAVLGERGDLVAVKTAEIGDNLLQGESPEQSSLEELQETLNEIEQFLAVVEKEN